MIHKIFVTGGTGFIGQHCLNYLLGLDLEIHALCRDLKTEYNKRIQWHKADLNNFDQIENLLAEIKPDYLLHLAWKVETGLSLDSSENEKWSNISIHLIEQFYRHGGKRVCVSGSCFEYNLNSGIVAESDEDLLPSNEYGKNKRKVYEYLKSVSLSNGYSYIWPRIFFTFGPGQKPTSLLPYVLSQMKDGEKVELTDCNQEYDYLYVEDVAKGLVDLLLLDYIGSVNLSSGSAVKLKDLVQHISEFFNSEHLINFGLKQRPVNSPDLILGANSLLCQLLPNFKIHNIKEALTKTIKYNINKNE